MRILWQSILVLNLSLGFLPGAQVKLGSEVLASQPTSRCEGQTRRPDHQSFRCEPDLESTIDVLRAAPGVKLVALFGPEHGIYGERGAGEKVASTRRRAHRFAGLFAVRHDAQADAEMLQGLDALVYDLQDTGCRSYTFISTMGLAMEACGEAGLEFVVLDRPDPVGGERIEGPMLEGKFRSSVGRWKVPYVYGLTCGELARMINGEGWIKKPLQTDGGADERLETLDGLARHRSALGAGLAARAAWRVAAVPGGHRHVGEFGGVSTGIGYTLPFECVAAPNVDPQKLADALNGYHLPGVHFQPITYKPYYFTFKNR